ncbi:MAG: outer membrane lipoprotein carrier protein LolA [Candidatus Eisenbacteria bacterium]|nr:outer membrane lipoprotein carrier protein LolA [Candidatus Eisenbacteria bacterium]
MPVLAALLGLVAVLTFPRLALAEETRQGEPAGETRLSSDKAALKLIGDVIERYESEASYKLTFQQETYWSLADTTFVSNGVLLLEQPSLLSIRYDDGSRVVADGESVWVYVAQTNQFLATNVDSSDVVMDPPRLLRQYAPDPSGTFPTPTPARPEGKMTDNWSTVALSLKPRGGVGEPASLDVYVDQPGGLVRQIVARSRSGDLTRYTVLSTELGVTTKPSDFKLSRPSGAQRLTGDGAGLR